MSTCDICGPDVGPYAETHQLVAVMHGELDHARELVAQSYSAELRMFADQLDDLTGLIGDRLGYGGP